MSDETHWERIYQERGVDEVSWYRPHLDTSLHWIEALELPLEAAIVDAGGGASTLVDDLLERGFTDLTVIDLSRAALARSQTRLGERADEVRWLQGDVTEPLLAPDSVDLWHDRAVLHFLTEPAQLAAYVEQVRRCLRPGGHAMIATFACDGPEKCSGLEVTRRDPPQIAEALGSDFALVEQARHTHHTPWGSAQRFAHALCRYHP